MTITKGGDVGYLRIAQIQSMTITKGGDVG